jgi:hypothetical protein
VDDDGAFQFPYLIQHSNGHLYLLFRVGLYGYGVFGFMDKKEFLHVPKDPESFIWTDAHYNPANDMLGGRVLLGLSERPPFAGFS